MLEKELEYWLSWKVHWLGGMSFKFVSPGNAGVPDRIFVLPGGEVWFVELKTENGSLTRVQQYQGERLRRAGCNYRVIRGKKEAEEWIDEIRAARVSDLREG